MKMNLVMAKDRIDFFEGMVKIEHLGDDSRCYARVARPKADRKRQDWKKAAPGHDAAANLGSVLWLKIAQNGAPGSQVNKRHRLCLSLPLTPRSGDTLRNQAARASWSGVATQAVALRATHFLGTQRPELLG
ncbi:hypothetical protein MRX96_044141 [Rhipicephalus microplus]